MAEEDEAVVAQYGWLKVSDRLRGSEMCVFRSVHVDASVDDFVVLQSGPMEMPAVLVVVELAFYAARMTAWFLEFAIEKARSSRRWW